MIKGHFIFILSFFPRGTERSPDKSENWVRVRISYKTLIRNFFLSTTCLSIITWIQLISYIFQIKIRQKEQNESKKDVMSPMLNSTDETPYK